MEAMGSVCMAAARAPHLRRVLWRIEELAQGQMANRRGLVFQQPGHRIPGEYAKPGSHVSSSLLVSYCASRPEPTLLCTQLTDHQARCEDDRPQFAVSLFPIMRARSA